MSQKETSINDENQSTQSEDSMIEFLNNNPNFIRDNIENLINLDIPHDTGIATSLIERQVKVLRVENLKIKTQLNQLIKIARDNEELSHRIHQLFLETSNTESVDDLMATIQEQLKQFFNTDFVQFKFYSMPELKDHINDDLVFVLKNKQASKLKKWIKIRKPECADITHEVLAPLFAEQEKLKSIAVIPLYGMKEFGVILLGSLKQNRFSSNKGSVFLTQLGELVSHRLVSLIKE